MAKLLGAKNTTMTLANEATVPVQVANGRVYHQNFAFKISGTTLHTAGPSASMIRSIWLSMCRYRRTCRVLKNNPLLVKAVAGKVVKVPVKGTLSKPVIDAEGVRAGGGRAGPRGAKDVGKDLLDRELAIR